MSKISQQIAKDFVLKYWSDEGECPKHEKLKIAFANSIKDGFWQSGMRLPTEVELTASTPCSLGTIQRALRGLAADGLIERRRGSGSVVMDLSGKLADPWHIRYRDPKATDNSFLPLETTVLHRKQITETGPWSRILNQGSQTITKIDRIFTVDSSIRIYSEFYSLSKRFPEFMTLPKADLNGMNFKKLIASHYQAPTFKVRQCLRFETPPHYILEHGNYQADVLIPVLNVVSIALNEEPIYYQDFHLPLQSGSLDLGIETSA